MKTVTQTSAPPAPYALAAIPEFESERLKELYGLDILDTDQEERFDAYTRFASQIFNLPIALISLVDTNRQWFKSACGVNLKETGRDISFCSHALHEESILVIPNAVKDIRFKNNPLVTDKGIHFYAGAVLRGPKGYPVGTLCLLDYKPRMFSARLQKCLVQLGQIVARELQSNFLLTHVCGDLEKAVYYNPVTDLPNRRLFTERLKKLLKPGHPQEFSIFSLAIHRLTEIREGFGDILANEIVLEVSQRLRKTLEAGTSLAHDQNDNFLILSERNNNAPTENRAIRKILSIFDKPFFADIPFHSTKNRIDRLQGSLGLSIYPQHERKAEECIEKSIVAMHSAATSNLAFKLYNADLCTTTAYFFDTESRLRRAIESDLLRCAYQPVVDCKTLQVLGAEALCRWFDREKGEISPIEFIPVAEETGLIIALGDWILNHACTQATLWHKQGFGKPFISVNITRAQLLEDRFVEKVKLALKKSKLPANCLRLEITESAFIDNISSVVEKITALKDLGVVFYLDDFGTGYSSLSYLRNIPVTGLKIDQSFVKSLIPGTVDERMLRCIISLGKNLNLKIVAEGIEKEGQLKILQENSCDYGQGYLFSKPLLAKDYETYLNLSPQTAAKGLNLK